MLALNLERRPVFVGFCYVNGGGAKAAPALYLRNGLEFFDAVFTNWQGITSTILPMSQEPKTVKPRPPKSKWRPSDRM